MKAMKKALALGLALAMVVTAVPVTSAQAASTAKLSASKVSVAAGTAKKQTKSIKVTTPSTWKSVKVKASSSDKKIATVKVSGKTVKVTAVKKGSAKVTVKVSAKKSGKTVKKTLTAKVKVINAGLRFVDPATEVVVGESVSLAAKKSPKAAVVTYKSSDDTIATVDADGKVTAVKAGKVTITATSDYLTKEVTTDVTVKEIVLTGVKQTKINQIELTYNGDASKIGKDDVVITRTSDKQRIYTKAVANNATDKKLTVDTVLDMTDSKEFTVTIKDSTETFTATDGKLAGFALDKTEIVYNTATKISLVKLDAQGVELGTLAYNNGVAVDNNTVDFKIDVTSDKGYITADGLVLNKVGDTAKVTAEKHSGVYVDGKETGNIKFEGTVTAIEAADIATDETWTLAAAAPFDWSKVTPQHYLIMNEPANLYMYVKDTKGAELVKGNPTPKYTIVSMNKDVLFVDGNTLTPNKVGNAVININDKNGKTVWSYLVEVKEAAKPVSFTASKSQVTLSNSTYAAATASVDLVAKDQYGRDINGNYVVTETLANGGSASTVWSGTVTNDGTKKATLTFKGATGSIAYTKGTYSYKVELKHNGATVYTSVVNVTIQEPNYAATPTYALLLDGENAAKTVDITVKGDSLDAKTVNIQVGMFYDGVLGGYYDGVTNAAIEMKDPWNADVATAAAATVGKREDVTATNATDFDFYVRTTGPAFATSNYVMNQATAGTYTVSVKVPNGTGLKDIKQYIIVKNDQPKVVVAKRDQAETVDATSAGASDATKGAILAAFEFSYDNITLTGLKNGSLIPSPDGTKYEIGEANIDGYEATNVTTLADGSKRAFIKNVTVKIPVVFGDLTAVPNGIDATDVVYITQKVDVNYYLQWK